MVQMTSPPPQLRDQGSIVWPHSGRIINTAKACHAPVDGIVSIISRYAGSHGRTLSVVLSEMPASTTAWKLAGSSHAAAKSTALPSCE